MHKGYLKQLMNGPTNYYRKAPHVVCLNDRLVEYKNVIITGNLRICYSFPRASQFGFALQSKIQCNFLRLFSLLTNWQSLIFRVRNLIGKRCSK